jgi:hypothetical protein
VLGNARNGTLRVSVRAGDVAWPTAPSTSQTIHLTHTDHNHALCAVLRWALRTHATIHDIATLCATLGLTPPPRVTQAIANGSIDDATNTNRTA